MDNYQEIKDYIKFYNKKVENETFEDIYHDLLLKNLNKNIQKEKTYFYQGFKFRLMNNNTMIKQNQNVLRQYVEKFDNITYQVNSDSKLLCVIINEIEKLPNKTRSRIKEYLFKDMSISEIAKVNKLNYDTVKATIRRGLSILQERLQKWNQD